MNDDDAVAVVDGDKSREPAAAAASVDGWQLINGLVDAVITPPAHH